MPDTLPPPISMSVEAGTCGATGKPASPPNSLQGIVANRRHGKPATGLQVCRWHTHHTLTACHRWRRQAEPADIMQAASTKPHWDWRTTAPQYTQRKRTKKKSKPMHNTHYPLGTHPKGVVCVSCTRTWGMSGKEKNQKKRRGGKPPHPRLSQGATPHIGRESDSITMGFSPAGTRQSHMKALKAMSKKWAMPFFL